MSFQVRTKQNAFTPVDLLPQAPGFLSFYETMALNGLEDKWIRLDAKTQRAILGFPIFGKQEFRVNSVTCDVEVARSTCFGTMKEVQDYGTAWVRTAITTRKVLSPGCWGERFVSGPCL